MWGGSVEGSVGSFEGVMEAWRLANESLIVRRLVVGVLEAQRRDGYATLELRRGWA
jgi:hypothetical protein